MRIINCVQCSPEWWIARRGVPTASNFGRIITPAKRGYSSQARKYACELIAELSEPNPPWLTNTGRPIRNTAMQNGVGTEPEARRFYAMDQNVDVREVGFCLTDDLRYGCSPDGLVGEDGGLEIKCPLLATHAEYLDAGEVPPEYLPQVHGSLVVTGRKWWDFLSYAPGLPPLLVRTYPNDFTAALRNCLDRFWGEYQALRRKLVPPADAGDAWEPERLDADEAEPGGSMSDWAQKPAANAAR